MEDLNCVRPKVLLSRLISNLDKCLLIRLFVILVSLTMLTNCATLNEDECLTADWYQIGFDDGLQGYADRTDAHTKACQKHQIDVDAESYQVGRDGGLNSFCTYESGVAHGEKGRDYLNVCTGSAHEEFYSGYRPHFEVAQAEKGVSTANSSISRNQRILNDSDSSSKDRASARTNLTSAKNSLKEYERALSKANYELNMHLFEREINRLTELAKDENLTDLERDEIDQQIKLVNETRNREQRLYGVERTVEAVRDIKDIIFK